MGSLATGALAILFVQSLVASTMATGCGRCSNLERKNSPYTSQNQLLWNHPGLRHLDWLDLWPLGGGSGYPPSQIYRLMEDSLDLLNEHGLTLRKALKPYNHLLNGRESLEDGDKSRHSCDHGQEDHHTPIEKGDGNTPGILSETFDPRENGDNNNLRKDELSHSLRDAHKLWDNWQKELDDFWRMESGQTEDSETLIMRNLDNDLKQQEQFYQEQLKREEELERALQQERSKSRASLERIDKHKQEMAKQKDREMEEKKRREQREAILIEKRRQVELENLRIMERESLLKRQREDEEKMRLKYEEIERRRNEEAMRQSEMDRREKETNKQRNNGFGTSNDRTYMKNHGNEKTHHSSLSELYSTQIPENYTPRDIHVSLNRAGPRIEITGKRVCGCYEKCVIKEFERGFSIPEDYGILKAVLYKDGKLSVYGRLGRRTSTDPDGDINTSIPLETIDYPEEDVDNYKERLECLRKKSGIKVHKMDKRTGQTYQDEEFRDIENEYKRTYKEKEYDDDEVTIEIVE